MLDSKLSGNEDSLNKSSDSFGDIFKAKFNFKFDCTVCDCTTVIDEPKVPWI